MFARACSNSPGEVDLELLLRLKKKTKAAAEIPTKAAVPPTAIMVVVWDELESD